MNTGDRQEESCSAAELRRGSKTVFYADGCEDTLEDEQREFFFEVDNEDGEFVRGRAKVGNSHDFKTPANLAIADAGPERQFIRELTRHENAQRIDAWLKNTPVGFYTIEYAWKKGEHPKRGEFSPDFFIKQGTDIFVVEIKGNEEIGDPGADNIKKYEYAVAHFRRLNEWLTNEGFATRYHFNMLSPKSYNVFFQKLRDGELDDFRSDLDVVMSGAAKAAA
jgi:type III restriction enzyme